MLSAAMLAQTRKTGGKKTAAKATATAKPSGETQGMTAHAKALFDDMLPNTQRIFIIDSTVVDRDNVLGAMPLPSAYGKFVDYDTFFGKQTGSKQTVFVNGFGNRCYYTEVGTDSISRLYMSDRLGNAWGKPQPISEVNDNFTDISFPYMSSDGQTLYFAGVSNTEGLGQRDIYMTKYNADEGTFMPAENIGLPFNSSADDYAFVMADADRIAWFATTRRQPAGKACVYAFVPAEQRQNYSIDELGRNHVASLAAIMRIRETWPTPEIRDKAVARLRQLAAKAEATATQTDIMAFVVDDNHTYTSIDQFRSDATRKAYYDIARQQNDLRRINDSLDDLRTQYHNTAETQRAAIGARIARLEQQQADTAAALRLAEQELRHKESNLLKNQ